MKNLINYLKSPWIIILILLFAIYFLIAYNKLWPKPIKKYKTEWRYEIHGYVIHKGKLHPATWFTDTIEIENNFISYHNSDGTQVVIPTPYVLIDYKYNKVIEDTTKTFH